MMINVPMIQVYTTVIENICIHDFTCLASGKGSTIMYSQTLNTHFVYVYTTDELCVLYVCMYVLVVCLFFDTFVNDATSDNSI